MRELLSKVIATIVEAIKLGAPHPSDPMASANLRAPNS